MSKKKNQKNFMVMLVLLPIVAVVVSSYMVYRGVENYISTSSYFKVRDLKVEGITDLRYVDVMKQEILGVNIFDDQVDKLSEKIKKKFPTFNSVIVMRVLPSTLQIVAKERIPVAVIRRDVFYLFDTEGVIVSSFTLSEPIDFPVISGLDNKLRVLKVGASYRLGVLRDVLGLAKVLRQQRFYIDSGLPRDSRLKITKIDASDPGDFSFYLGESIQVKVGYRDFENKINLFSSILKSLSGDIANVKYIDLRPKEPAVAMKKEASKR